MSSVVSTSVRGRRRFVQGFDVCSRVLAHLLDRRLISCCAQRMTELS